MRDVAALAGVGVKTVSRVVNGESGVSAELSTRVLDAVELLGYRHDMAARSLRRADRRTATIGLLLDDLANPFSSALHRAVEDVAWQRGFLVFAGSSDASSERERELLRAFVSHRVDGLLLVPALFDHSTLLPERRLGAPVVFVDRLPVFLEADSVTADNRNGAATAVRHLVAYGHRHIAFLGDLHTIWTARERHAGYQEGLAAEGVAYDESLVRYDVHGLEVAERVALELLDGPDPPTAVFSGQNLITAGVVRALRRRGAQHRVALVGFDDLLLADLIDPPVTVVAQDPAGLGRAAAELLFARLEGDAAPPRQLTVPTRLVPRGSGEIPPSA